MSWLGIDIGGANLKVANTSGYARERFFPLWQRPMELAAAIGELLAEAPEWERLAVTMTGELADCYASKAEGVAAITAAALNAAVERPVSVYTTGGTFVSADDLLEDCDQAGQLWQGVAAANWHAIALGIARRFLAEGVLIDIGSTTTDIIPLQGGTVATDCLTDTARLIAGQLLYQGVDRTPLCAIAKTLPYRERECPVAADMFATVGDVALLLGEREEDFDNMDTADGKPRTKIFARQRLARMVCGDLATFEQADAELAAERVVELLQESLSAALARVVQGESLGKVVLSGSGAWLSRKVLGERFSAAEVLELSELLGADSAVCAGAEAVAFLASSAEPKARENE